LVRNVGTNHIHYTVSKPKRPKSLLNTITASLKRSYPIKFSGSSYTYTFMPFRCAICPAYLIHFDLIIVVRLREAYNLLRPLLCNFLPTHITSPPASFEFSSMKSKTTIHKLQHNLHAHTRRVSLLYLKSITFMGK
jgi:hypothetical protein